MSEVSDTQSGQKAGRHEDQGALSTVPMQSSSGETSRLDLHGLLPAGHSSSTDISPSPSEAAGLLSLPWEILTNITSHLPAHCVLNVLPQVCHALASVAKDSTSWQLRARKIVGSRRFPVGPKENFNWPAACIELEQLISHWTVDVHHASRRIPCHEAARGPDMPQQQAEQGAEPAAERQGDGFEDELEVLGAAAQQMEHVSGDVANQGGDEMQPMIARAHEAQMRELEERQRDEAAALMEDGFADARNQPNGGHAELMQHQPSRCQSPPPELEHMSLCTSHIAHINSILLLGGEGRVCATASRDRNVMLWDLEAGSEGTVLRSMLKSYLMSMSSSGKEVWGGGNSGTLYSISMQSDSFGLVSDFDVGHTDLVTGIHKSPGSLYTCSADRTVQIHIPCAPPKTLCTLHHEGPVLGLSVQAGVLAIASGSVNVELWRPRR